jgi:hypothetical protein
MSENNIYYLKGCDNMKEYPKEVLDAIHKELDRAMTYPGYYDLLEECKKVRKLNCEAHGIPYDEYDDIE